MTSPAVETLRLTKRYGASRGVEDLTLRVARGEIFGLLGPNGAGKTTTIRTLLDLLHPTSGRALVLGLDSRADSLAIHARVGNLPGDFACDPRMTGRDLLRFCARVRGLTGLGRAPQLAARFGADLDRPIGELSRGNRQKVGLVQALQHEPELLILDEPTSGLDPLMQEEFHAVVAEHHDAGGTVLLSSHDLGEVQRLCGRVAIVRDGRLVIVEEVDALRARAHRQVTIDFADPIDPAELLALPGVSELHVTGTRVSLAAHGSMDAIVKAAAHHTVLDIEITEPTLERLFLTYYEGQETA